MSRRDLKKIAARPDTPPINNTVDILFRQLPNPLPFLPLRSDHDSAQAYISAIALDHRPSMMKLPPAASTAPKLRKSARLRRRTSATTTARPTEDIRHRICPPATRGLRRKKAKDDMEAFEEDLSTPSSLRDNLFNDKLDLSYGLSNMDPSLSEMATSPREGRGYSQSPSKDTTRRSWTRSQTKQPSEISGDGSALSRPVEFSAGNIVQLASFTPAVLFQPISFSQPSNDPTKGHLQAQSEACTVAARRLWMERIRPALTQDRTIPEGLKSRVEAAIDTPSKSSLALPSGIFESTMYGHDEFVWQEISEIVKQAKELRHTDAPESHWLAVIVHPMLRLLRRLNRFDTETRGIVCPDLYVALQRYMILIELVVDTLSRTTTPISPPSLCPYSACAIFEDLDKRIDCGIGLRLTNSERTLLARNIAWQAQSAPSINQTSSFVNYTPMFANIEMKVTTSSRHPLLQLAAWVAAEFNKRKIEGYSMKMPVLAIRVTEDQWDVYIVHAVIVQDGFELRFLGPNSMGSTSNIQDALKLLKVLVAIAEFGNQEFREHYVGDVLAKCWGS